MIRLALSAVLAFFTMAAPALAQVQTLGEVSFAVPEGWKYQQKPGADFAAMALQEGGNYWVMAVYTPMPSSGDATADLKAAWQRIVLAGGDYRGFPALPYYDIAHTVGYPGKRADDSSNNRATYTRLYVLEAGKMFIPAVAVSNDGQVLNAKEHIANAFIGSIRLAPLKASPIKTNLALADLAGDWKSGMANSMAYYSTSTGQYVGSSNTFYGAGYHIAANGSFTYKMSGMADNRMASDADSGVVELGGEFVTFKGRNHVVRYRFLNVQTAIDGSTVLTLLPPGDMAHISIVRDSEVWSRAPQGGNTKK